MTDKLRKIRLYGVLGAKFGRVHELAVNSPAEAIKALSVMIPGFEKFLLSSNDRGLTYSIFIGRENISKDQLTHPVGSDDIRIAPIVDGSKKGGLFQTIAGVVLMVASIWYPPLFNVGLALTMGGVAQMLAPQPQAMGSADRPENRPSYAFNGPVNTRAQGNPVPILYGEMIIGSAVISAGIYAENQR
ncbi:tail assembly protein [Pseudomonas phage ZQG1]|nr:tail assembly protein [Pseudomonas phage ZQG1]